MQMFHSGDVETKDLHVLKGGVIFIDQLYI